MRWGRGGGYMEISQGAGGGVDSGGREAGRREGCVWCQTG